MKSMFNPNAKRSRYLLLTISIVLSFANLMGCEEQGSEYYLNKITQLNSSKIPNNWDPEVSIDLGADQSIGMIENQVGILFTVTGILGTFYTITAENATVEPDMEGEFTKESISFVLRAEQEGEVVLTIVVKDYDGNKSNAYVLTTAADLTPPTLIEVDPLNLSVITPEQPIQLTFSEAIDPTTMTWLDDAGEILEDTIILTMDSTNPAVGTLTPASTWAEVSPLLPKLSLTDSAGNGLWIGSLKYTVSALPQWAFSLESSTTNTSIEQVKWVSENQIVALCSAAEALTLDFGDTTLSLAATDSNGFLLSFDSNGTVTWATGVESGTPTSYRFEAMAVDAVHERIFVCGSIQGGDDPIAYDFGNSVVVTSVGEKQASILLAYDLSGTAQWGRAVTSAPDSCTFSDIGVESAGNIYLIGNIQGTGAYDFGSGAVAGLGTYYNPILIKYTSEGVASWVKTLTASPQMADYTSIFVSTTPNIYIAGHIVGTSTAGWGTNVEITGYSGFKTAFLLKYNSAGDAEWVKGVDSQDRDISYLDTVGDIDENLYAVGYVYGPATLDLGSEITATFDLNEINGLFVKYNSSGTPQWIYTMAKEGGRNAFRSIDYDLENTSLIIGGAIDANSRYDLGNEVSVKGTSSSWNMLLFQADLDGVVCWARSVYSGSASTDVYSIGVSPGTTDYYGGGWISGTETIQLNETVSVHGSFTEHNLLYFKYAW